MRPRLQFTLRTLLVATLVVAAFLGGMALQKRLDKPLYIQRVAVPKRNLYQVEIIELNGRQWTRAVVADE